ncbi:MAG: alpha/beta hydrolase [Gordonia sp. (in: high G+C Gram-positive bacteria)]|uniref:alpha/beta hydrolase n=1 Tax=Gordonia sp. (in: high G+C Gram-positive bacteria) TaxID=84139 RepID=UPI003C75861F
MTIDPAITAAYDARGTVTPEEFDETMRRYRSRSDESTRDLPGTAGIVYDEHSGERLDIWGTGDRPRPVFFVIHGGYWRMLSRSDTAFMARALADAGIATVAVDYGLAPATSLDEIVRQVRAALAWVHRHGGEHGLDVNRIVVGGSSAGAHLAAMTMVDGWQAAAGIPADAARGGLLLSGLFDLRPLVRARPNEWLFLTDETAAELSPALAQPPLDPRSAVIAVAEREAPGFHRQSRELHGRWCGADGPPLITVAGRDHFDVFLDLADPSTELSRALRSLIDATAASPEPTSPVTAPANDHPPTENEVPHDVP